MSHRTSSIRRFALASAACILLGVAGRSQAQVTFTPPADAPDGGNGTIGVLEVSGLAIAPVPPATDVTGGIPNCCGDQNQARTALTSASGPGIIRRTYSGTAFNFLGDGTASGHFTGDQSINVPAGQFNDNKAYMFRGNIAVPAAGTYTFNVNSDDGFTLAFNGGTVPFTNLYNSNTGNAGSITSYNGNANGALTFFGGRGTEDTGAQVNFPSAGNYHFDVTFHDGCCGDAIEVAAAQGAKTSFDNSFALIGQKASTKTKKFTGVGQWDTFTFANVNNMASTIAAYQNGDPSAFRSRSNETTLAFNDPQNANNGSHAADARTYPGDTGVDDNNFGTAARATFNVTAANAGRYTFVVYPDDGFRLRILKSDGTTITPIPGSNTAIDTASGGLTSSGGLDNCCQDFLGKFDVPAGNYTLEMISNEIGGGAGLFVYGAFGNFDAFDPQAFQLVGLNLDQQVAVPAGLQLVAAPEPGTLALAGVFGLAALMRRRRTAA
jgi:uncharacterized protein (TIGR03382 family)